MPRDQPTQWRVGPHDAHRGAALGGFELPPRDAGGVAQGAQHLSGLEGREVRHPFRVLDADLAVRALDRLEQLRHAVHRLSRRARLLDILKEVEERPWRPFRRQPQQVQQVPDLHRVHLHGRCRQQQQALRAAFQLPHQAQQGVGSAFQGASGGAPAGMVGLVEHDQVPRVGILQKGRRPVAAAHQVARRDDDRFLVPVLSLHLAFVPFTPCRGGVPAQLAAVVDRPVEIELLA